MRQRRITVDQPGAMPALPRQIPGYGTIAGVTGVILAGGASSRMKSNKALLPYEGGRFIEVIYRHLATLFDEVLVVTNTPEQYEFLPCRKVADCYPGAGPLAGIHAALQQSVQPRIMVVACDMPFLNEGLIWGIVNRAVAADVIIPESSTGLEPLHALYAKSCLPAISAALAAGEKRIVSFFHRVVVHRVPLPEVLAMDPAGMGFRNINTPEDYYQLRQVRPDFLPPEELLRRVNG